MDIARLVEAEEHTADAAPHAPRSVVDIAGPDPGIRADMEGQPVTAVFHWAVKWECRDRFERWTETFSRTMRETYPVGFQVLTHPLPVHGAAHRTPSPRSRAGHDSDRMMLMRVGGGGGGSEGPGMTK